MIGCAPGFSGVADGYIRGEAVSVGGEIEAVGDGIWEGSEVDGVGV
jgi:hypothetical protein